MSGDYTAVNVPGRWAMEKDVEITRLRAENEKLRAALKPFADAAQHYCIWKEHDDYFVGGKHLKFGDLRAAAAALKETGDE